MSDKTEWVLVPREPTPEMVMAGGYLYPDQHGHAGKVYTSMLAAAPQPPAEAQAQGGGEVTLPCDVRLPPATTITAGCKLSTLLSAMELRRKNGVVNFPAGALGGADAGVDGIGLRDALMGAKDKLSGAEWDALCRMFREQDDIIRAQRDRLAQQPAADPYFLGDVARRAWLENGSDSWVTIGRAIVAALAQQPAAVDGEVDCRCIDCGGNQPDHDPTCSYMRELHGGVAELAQQPSVAPVGVLAWLVMYGDRVTGWTDSASKDLVNLAEGERLVPVALAQQPAPSAPVEDVLGQAALLAERINYSADHDEAVAVAKGIREESIEEVVQREHGEEGLTFLSGLRASEGDPAFSLARARELFLKGQQPAAVDEATLRQALHAMKRCQRESGGAQWAPWIAKVEAALAAQPGGDPRPFGALTDLYSERERAAQPGGSDNDR